MTQLARYTLAIDRPLGETDGFTHHGGAGGDAILHVEEAVANGAPCRVISRRIVDADADPAPVSVIEHDPGYPWTRILTFEGAKAAHYEAVHVLIDQAQDEAAYLARSAYPTAAQLVLDGSWTEEGTLRVTLARVIDAAGNVLVDEEEPTETYDALSDRLEEPLGYLGDLCGDDWSGENELDITDDLPTPTPTTGA